MSICGECKSKTNRYEETIQCSQVVCKKLYHAKCVGMSEAEVTDLNSTGDISVWECDTCKKQDKKNPTNREIFLLLTEIKHQMKENQSDTNRRLDELEKSQSFIAQQYEEIKNMKNTIERAASFTEQVSQIECEQHEQKSELKILKNRINLLEQYSRRTCIELNQVKQRSNEDVNDIVLQIANACAITMSKDDIEAAHRLKTNPGKTPGIIVRFKSRQKANEFIERKRTYITNEKITQQGNDRIYICESLSPFYRELLWKAKCKAKACNFTFVWWKGASIYARKMTGSPAIKILSEEDLNKIN